MLGLGSTLHVFIATHSYYYWAALLGARLQTDDFVFDSKFMTLCVQCLHSRQVFSCEKKKENTISRLYLHISGAHAITNPTVSLVLRPATFSV